MPGTVEDAPTARRPRRRARKDADENGTTNLSQPQRKRPRLGEDTFVAPYGGHDDDGSEKQDHSASSTNGRASEKNGSPHVSMPHRSKSSGKQRPTKYMINTVTLTQSPNYSVRLSKTYPDELQSDPTQAVNGSFLAEDGTAIAITKDKVFVWDLALKVPNVRTLPLTHATRSGEPLCIGRLVAGATPAETGLMVVAPTTGKITYWESVHDAHALGLFAQKRNGVEGSVGSMFSGEVIVKVESIGQAGYIFILSSGRTAHVTLRDSRSQPTVTATFLRAPSPPGGGGVFGSLKKALIGSGWLRDTIAAKARPASTRGHMDVLVMNETASFQKWQLGWSGQSSFGFETHAKEELDGLVKHHFADGTSQVRVKALDFAIVSHPKAEDYRVLLLAAISSDSISTFALVHVTLRTDGTAKAESVIAQLDYTSGTLINEQWQPAIFVSILSQTAFVVFERAVFLVGVESLESGLVDRRFQDVVYLNDDQDVAVVGAILSTSVPADSVQMFVRGHGVVAVTINNEDNTEVVRRIKVTPKDKIEQVIFYSMVPNSPINLSRTIDAVSPLAEIEKAALSVSREIITSSSDHLQGSNPNMTKNLEWRSTLLAHLALHLKAAYPTLSRETRWKLRWDGEKLAAAAKLWADYDHQVRFGGDSPIFLIDIIQLLMGDNPPASHDKIDMDPTRSFFMNNIDRMQAMLSAAAILTDGLFRRNPQVKENEKGIVALDALIGITTGIFETAWRFRSENALLYDLGQEQVEDDLLTGSYAGLPEFWTSIEDNTIHLTMIPEQAAAVAEPLYEQFDAGSPESRMAAKVCGDLGRVVDIALKCCTERMRWLEGSTTRSAIDEKKKLSDLVDVRRPRMVESLVGVGLFDTAVAMAQKYLDLKSLAWAVREQSGYMMGIIRSDTANGHETEEANQQVRHMERLVKELFQKYGYPWTEEFYSGHVEGKLLAGLLEQSSAYPAEVTAFLRHKSGRKKLSWINDVLSEKDFERAAKTLTEVAVDQESDLWSKRVELSISKLAGFVIDKSKERKAKQKLASTSSNEWNDLPADMVVVESNDNDVRVAASEGLELVAIEETLYEHIKPLFQDAVDQAAEVQLAMDEFGSGFTRGKNALKGLLENGISNLAGRAVLDIEQLIDVLTLMDIVEPGDDKPAVVGFAGLEISLALRALKYSGLAKQDAKRYELLLGMVWRRCYLKDDWDVINKSLLAVQSDEELTEQFEDTILFKTLFEGYSTGLFDDSNSLPILDPTSTAVLTAGTNINDHTTRFSSDALAKPIAQDNTAEVAELQTLIKKAHLGRWNQAISALALEAYNKACDEETLDRQQAGEMAQGIRGGRNGRELEIRRTPDDV